MEWYSYVGERFTHEGKTFLAETYDPRFGFVMSEIKNRANRLKIDPKELGRSFNMIIVLEPSNPIKSIKNHRYGNDLLEKALFLTDVGVPLVEQVKTYRQNGFSMRDVWLTMKGVELILRGREKK